MLLDDWPRRPFNVLAKQLKLANTIKRQSLPKTLFQNEKVNIQSVKSEVLNEQMSKSLNQRILPDSHIRSPPPFGCT